MAVSTMTYIGDVMGKPRMTHRDRRGDKRPVVARYHVFRDMMRLQARNQGFNAYGTLTLSIAVPMPKSWSKKKKAEMQGKPHTQKPDLDNYAKAILDALYQDDSVVHTLVAAKRWGPDDEPGSIAIVSTTQTEEYD